MAGHAGPGKSGVRVEGSNAGKDRLNIRCYQFFVARFNMEMISGMGL